MNETKLSIVFYKRSSEKDFECCKNVLETIAETFDADIHTVEETTGNEEEIIDSTQGEYVLLMDSRVWIGEDILRTLCFFLDEHPEAGMVGVKMLDGHGSYLPESRQKFPSSWKRLLHKSGVGTPSGKTATDSSPTDREEICDIPSAPFYLFKRETWNKVRKAETKYTDYPTEVKLADQMRSQGFTNYYIPERVLFMKEGQPVHPHKKRRMLIVGYEKEAELIKKITSVNMPDLEFVNLWDLRENRLMDAICRQTKMKNFTDISFSWPEIRMEQILLFMERMPEKTISYHIYHTPTNLLISTVR